MTLVLKDEYLPVPPTAAIPRRFVVLGTCAAFFVGAVLGLLLTFYHWHAHHGFARTLARVLPLPAGHVEGKIVWYVQVSERANALEALADVASHESIDHAFLREQRNALLEQLAEELGVEVNADDVAAFIAEDEELRLLKERAGWSERDYRNEVHLHLLAKYTERALLASAVHQAYARGKAQRIQSRLDEGIAFADLAPHYSDGETAALGGDLGYVDVATLPAPLAEAARTLPIDGLSDILETETSFWLLTVEDRLPVDIQNGEMAWVRVMEVKKDLLGDIVDRELATANVADWLR